VGASDILAMHEWAISESILNSAIDSARAQGILKLTKIRIGVGELAQLEPDILRFALEKIKAGTLAGTAILEIETVPARFSCRSCENEWGFADVKAKLFSDVGKEDPLHYVPDFIYSFMRCPRCDSPDFNITSGRDTSFSVEGEK